MLKKPSKYQQTESLMPGFLLGQSLSALVGLLMWMALIFTLSALPDLKSPLLTSWDLLMRKIAHFAAYSIFVVLAYWYLAGRNPGLRISALIQVLLLALTYAVLDEAHQRFVPGRMGAARDVLIDLSGSVAMLIWIAWWSVRQAKRRARQAVPAG
jgi:VanZ family protein